jgi:hypothetical protein
MSEGAPTLEEILSRFDAALTPLDDHDVHSAISELRKREIDAGLGYPLESVAECVAFMFCPEYHWKGDGWDSYYGPMFGMTDKDGKPAYSPDIKQLDAATFTYWDKRAREAKHPLLKIRYADLCWEFQKRITGASPHIDMARIAIDSSIDATSQQLVKHAVNGRKKLARALAIAVGIGDGARVERVRDAIVAYEDAVARDEAAGLWGFSFDLILENKKVPRSAELETKLIGDLEGRLARLSAGRDGKPVDAWGAEYAATRLANYYRRANRPDDVRRVLMLYGAAFEKLSEGGSGMQASGWLRRVHDHYREFGLRDEAEAVLLKVREYSKKSHDEMGVQKTPIEVPKKEMDEFLESLTRGDLSESLHRLAVEFVPDRKQIISQIEQMRQTAPLMAMIAMTIVDQEGRPTSQIGSVDDDMDGRIAHQISQNLRVGQMFLYLAINHIREKFSMSVDDLLNHLRQSPVFPEDGFPMLLAGLEAYLRDDHLAASHLLVPQIEAATRHLLDLCRGNLWKPHRGGGLMLKNLEDVLREEAIEKSLTENNVLYLRVLLTDQRGWNVRNGVCHGLFAADSFGRGMTDRLLHALLLLALIRNKPDAPTPPGAGAPVEGGSV